MGVVFFVVFCVLIVAFINLLTNNEDKISELNELIKEFGDGCNKVDVKIVSRRIESKGQYSATRYFVTFENIQNLKRVEFEVTGEQYGVMVEGDAGQLSNIEDKISFVRKFEEINKIEKKIEVKDIYVKVVFKGTKNDGGVTRYFVAFENIDNGECTEMEFPVEQYKLILEGDTGKLIYKDKDVSFEREIHTSKKIDLVKR